MASGFEEQPVIQGLRGERGNVRMPLASRTDFSVDWARGAISQWPAHHLRIRDAERRQRYARRGEGARAPAQRPAGEDQSLVPFNPWPGSAYECSDSETIEGFSEIVFNAGYASPVRTPRGRDILADCGQLRSTSEKLKARARMM